jgi:hypothetical protein
METANMKVEVNTPFFVDKRTVSSWAAPQFGSHSEQASFARQRGIWVGGAVQCVCGAAIIARPARFLTQLSALPRPKLTLQSAPDYYGATSQAP